MKKYYIIAILFITQMGIAKTIDVCKTCEISSIQQAINSAQKFDTLIFEKGTYESIDTKIDKPLTILSLDGAVLDGQFKSYILKIVSDSVTISGFTFINAGKSYTKDYAAVYLSRCKYFTLTNNRVENPFFGFLIEKSHHGIISNNYLFGQSKREDDSGNGIHLWHSSNILIQGNEVHDLRDGIYFEFVSKSTIRENYSHNNVRYGLHFMFSNNNEYIENTFSNNGAGVAVMFSKFITMRKNTFEKNWGTASYGLLLKEIYDAEISENKFIQNTIGIFTEGSTRINYYQNDFNGNGWAVKIAGACYTNNFERNNFLNNAFDISYNSKLNDNKFSGNYWSSYTGYDLDKNGIGDVPYRPVKLFSYIVNKTPETIVLLRSLFIDIINFSEKVSPVFTPDDLLDNQPLMRSIE